MRHETSDEPLYAQAHLLAGWIATVQRDTKAAIKHYELSIPAAKSQGNTWALARGLICLGTAYQYDHDYQAAAQTFEEVIEVCRKERIPGGVSMGLSNLAEVALLTGDLTGARHRIDECLAEMANAQDVKPEPHGQILCVYATVLMREGNCDEALENARMALDLFNRSSLIVNIPGAIQLIAMIKAKREDWACAITLLGASETLSASSSSPLNEWLSEDHERLRQLGRRTLGDGPFESAYSEGKALTLEGGVKMALTRIT